MNYLYPKQIAWYYQAGDIFFSLLRILLKSSWKKRERMQRKHPRCLILANAPSLNRQLENDPDFANDCDVWVVNHFVQSDLFRRIRPHAYLMCDPAFYGQAANETANENARKTLHALQEQTDWDMYLLFPRIGKNSARLQASAAANEHLRLLFFNSTRIDDFGRLSYRLYERGLGMPRPQNVLIAALTLALSEGYETICLAGADNDWMAHTWVDNDNRLRRDDLHFYQDDKSAHAMFLNITMPDFCASMYYTFNGYHTIENYRKTLHPHTSIINLSENSYIDAFPKPRMKQ